MNVIVVVPLVVVVVVIVFVVQVVVDVVIAPESPEDGDFELEDVLAEHVWGALVELKTTLLVARRGFWVLFLGGDDESESEERVTEVG